MGWDWEWRWRIHGHYRTLTKEGCYHICFWTFIHWLLFYSRALLVKESTWHSNIKCVIINHNNYANKSCHGLNHSPDLCPGALLLPLDLVREDTASSDYWVAMAGLWIGLDGPCNCCLGRDGPATSSAIMSCSIWPSSSAWRVQRYFKYISSSSWDSWLSVMAWESTAPKVATFSWEDRIWDSACSWLISLGSNPSTTLVAIPSTYSICGSSEPRKTKKAPCKNKLSWLVWISMNAVGVCLAKDRIPMALAILTVSLSRASFLGSRQRIWLKSP